MVTSIFMFSLAIMNEILENFFNRRLYKQIHVDEGGEMLQVKIGFLDI